MNPISKFDPTRLTTGAIYRDAQINGERNVIVGDVNYEIKKGLIEDINEAIEQGTKDLEGDPFYLAIYEKTDLQMKRACIRIRKITRYRPYPEQDSIVYHIIPKAEEVYFCWCLPHRSEMINKMNNPELFPYEELEQIRHWENLSLEHFGFMKDDEGLWSENPLYRGDALQGSKKHDDVTVSMRSESKLILAT